MANLIAVLRLPRSMETLLRTRGERFYHKGHALHVLVELPEVAIEGELPENIDGGRAGCRWFTNTADAIEWVTS